MDDTITGGIKNGTTVELEIEGYKGRAGFREIDGRLEVAYVGSPPRRRRTDTALIDGARHPIIKIGPSPTSAAITLMVVGEAITE